MKIAFLSILIFMIFFPEGKAQVVVIDGLYFNPSGRQIWVTKIEGEKLDRALLWKVSRDSVFIEPTSKKTILPDDSFPELIRFHYSEIENLTTLKNRPGITGLWSGAIVGFITGVIINSVTYQETTWQILDKGETDLLAGLFGAVVGAGGGAAVGAVAKKNWIISGDKISLMT